MYLVNGMDFEPTLFKNNIFIALFTFYFYYIVRNEIKRWNLRYNFYNIDVTTITKNFYDCEI